MLFKVTGAQSPVSNFFRVPLNAEHCGNERSSAFNGIEHLTVHCEANVAAICTHLFVGMFRTNTIPVI